MKLYKRSKAARQPNGFTVVQALMTASVVFVISGAFLTNQSYMRKSQSRMAAGVSRSSLAEVLHFNASSPLMIYRSSLRGTDVQQSSPLVACICGESGCLKDQERGFDLVDSEGRILAGENSDKVRFNILSEFCTAGQDCAFEAKSRFTCLGDNCGTSKVTPGNPSLKISYNLDFTSFTTANKNEYAYMKNIKGEPVVSVTDVQVYGLKNDLCVTGNSFTPVYGLSSGGTDIAISGTGLHRVQSVLFDNSPCTITARTKKSIQCLTPSHADGAVDVTLVYGAERYKLASTFMYYTPPPPPPPPEPPGPPGPGKPPEPKTGYPYWISPGFVVGPCCARPKLPCEVGQEVLYEGNRNICCAYGASVRYMEFGREVVTECKPYWHEDFGLTEPWLWEAGRR